MGIRTGPGDAEVRGGTESLKAVVRYVILNPGA